MSLWTVCRVKWKRRVNDQRGYLNSVTTFPILGFLFPLRKRTNVLEKIGLVKRGLQDSKKTVDNKPNSSAPVWRMDHSFQNWSIFALRNQRKICWMAWTTSSFKIFYIKMTVLWSKFLYSLNFKDKEFKLGVVAHVCSSSTPKRWDRKIVNSRPAWEVKQYSWLVPVS